jgi:hypothetical protein
VVLQKCCGVVTVVLQCWHLFELVDLLCGLAQQCYSVVTLVLQWWYSGVTEVLRCCYGGVTVLAPV